MANLYGGLPQNNVSYNSFASNSSPNDCNKIKKEDSPTLNPKDGTF